MLRRVTSADVLLAESREGDRLLPIPPLREDWKRGSVWLGSSLEDQPLHDLLKGLGSWRSLLPCLARETALKVLFLDLGASAVELSANQLGGRNPSIAPVTPFTLGCSRVMGVPVVGSSLGTGPAVHRVHALTTIVAAAFDRVVPPRHAVALYRAFPPGVAELVLVSDLDHNTPILASAAFRAALQGKE